MRVACAVYVKGDAPDGDEIRHVNVMCAEGETLIDIAYRVHV